MLVAPTRVVRKLHALSPPECASVFALVQRVQRMLEVRYDTRSSTVTVQCGPEAGQTVPHVHVHLLPRKQGDFADPDEIYKAVGFTRR